MSCMPGHLMCGRPVDRWLPFGWVPVSAPIFGLCCTKNSSNALGWIEANPVFGRHDNMLSVSLLTSLYTSSHFVPFHKASGQSKSYSVLSLPDFPFICQSISYSFCHHQWQFLPRICCLLCPQDFTAAHSSRHTLDLATVHYSALLTTFFLMILNF